MAVAAAWLAACALAPLPALAERGAFEGLADPAQGPLVWLLQKGLALEGGGGPPVPRRAAAAAEAADAWPSSNGTSEAAVHRGPYAVEIPGDAQLAPGLLAAAAGAAAGTARPQAGPAALAAAAAAGAAAGRPRPNVSGRGGGARPLAAAAVSAGAGLSQEAPLGVVGALASREWTSMVTKGSLVAQTSRVFIGRYDATVAAFERRWHEGRVLLAVFVMLVLWSHFCGPGPSAGSPLDVDEAEVESRRDAPGSVPPSLPGSVAPSQRASARPSVVPSRFGSGPSSRCHSPPRLQEECRFSRHPSGS